MHFYSGRPRLFKGTCLRRRSRSVRHRQQPQRHGIKSKKADLPFARFVALPETILKAPDRPSASAPRTVSWRQSCCGAPVPAGFQHKNNLRLAVTHLSTEPATVRIVRQNLTPGAQNKGLMAVMSKRMRSSVLSQNRIGRASCDAARLLGPFAYRELLPAVRTVLS